MSHLNKTSLPLLAGVFVSLLLSGCSSDRQWRSDHVKDQIAAEEMKQAHQDRINTKKQKQNEAFLE